MIEFTKSYKTSDDQVFATIEAAQTHEIVMLFDDKMFDTTSHARMAEFLLSKKDSLIDILTTKPSSKPKARKINGGSKPRNKKVDLHETVPLGAHD